MIKNTFSLISIVLLSFGTYLYTFGISMTPHRG